MDRGRVGVPGRVFRAFGIGGVGLAILIAIAYCLVHSLALSFAKAEMLPPLLAAWTANLVFAGLGLCLFLRART